MTLIPSVFSPFQVGAFTLAALAIVAPLPVALAQDMPLQLGRSPSGDAIALAPGGLETALAALPGLIAETLERSGIPGVAVAVVHGGETVFARGFGLRELGKPEPVDIDTVF